MDIVGVEFTDDRILRLMVEGIPGTQYQVQFSTTLESNDFADIPAPAGVFTAVAGPSIWESAPIPVVQELGFYRVRPLPTP